VTIVNDFICIDNVDSINENNPRTIDDARARKLAYDLKRCAYYETCATYGLNVERVFRDGLLLHFDYKQTLIIQRVKRLSTTDNCTRQQIDRPTIMVIQMVVHQ
jgi:hypothetical protein